MRILYFGNNWVGWQILRFLKEEGEEIVGLVIHPPNKRKYGDEIIEDAGVDDAHVFDGTTITQPKILQSIKELEPDIGISALFDYMLHRELFEIMSYGCINIHPAFLPYNRGNYPNVWSIVDETPAGVTIHYIDEKIDTGDIIAQREVEIEPVDTGESLYRKLEKECVSLFTSTWSIIRSGKAQRKPQTPEEGSFYRTSDVNRIDEIDLDRTYKARDLINIVRARTFPPYQGAYFIQNGLKVYLRLELMYEDESRES